MAAGADYPCRLSDYGGSGSVNDAGQPVLFLFPLAEAWNFAEKMVSLAGGDLYAAGIHCCGGGVDGHGSGTSAVDNIWYYENGRCSFTDAGPAVLFLYDHRAILVAHAYRYLADASADYHSEQPLQIR